MANKPVDILFGSDESRDVDVRITNALARVLKSQGGPAAEAEGDSPFQVLFGQGYVGRPVRSEHPTGVGSGDRKITETARRRAARVLRVLYSEEFDRIMELEAEWLRGRGGG